VKMQQPDLSSTPVQWLSLVCGNAISFHSGSRKAVCLEAVSEEGKVDGLRTVLQRCMLYVDS
jgi:hypothetical protein